MSDETVPPAPGVPPCSVESEIPSAAVVRRVLLIDDDPDIVEVTLLALRASGFVAESCLDPSLALPTAVAFCPDLVLLDAMMPAVDGPEVLRRLRADPQTAAVPVVFITARIDADAVLEYLELGAAAVIGKPFDPLTISARLGAITGRLG